jgi:hypothetical protein
VERRKLWSAERKEFVGKSIINNQYLQSPARRLVGIRDWCCCAFVTGFGRGKGVTAFSAIQRIRLALVLRKEKGS